MGGWEWFGKEACFAFQQAGGQSDLPAWFEWKVKR